MIVIMESLTIYRKGTGLSDVPGAITYFQAEYLWQGLG